MAKDSVSTYRPRQVQINKVNQAQTARLPLKPVIEDINQWPLTRTTTERKEFKAQVKTRTLNALKRNFQDSSEFYELLKNVIYLEKIRLTQNPWKTDKQSEALFWADIKSQLLELEKEEKHTSIELLEGILTQIINHYLNEILSRFEPRAYRLAQRILPYFYGGLLKSSPGRRIQKFWRSKDSIYDRFIFYGDIDRLRELSKIGPLIILPNHQSNLDSPTIGYGINLLGLPAMTYGAGINLFTLPWLSKKMNQLGAYKVDRRKKNAIYLEVLKSYSSVCLARGVHSLFFPEGTRSRSGNLSKKLKLGLLGTAVQTQKDYVLDEGQDNKPVVIVPVSINYSFTLEAESLIDQHLKKQGREQYIKEASVTATSYRLLSILFSHRYTKPEIHIAFGEPTDIFGNTLDASGRSLDDNGNHIDREEYFRRGNNHVHDDQRDSVYAQDLGQIVQQGLHNNKVVLSSNIVALVAFRMLKASFPKLDLYELLRLPLEDVFWEWDDFLDTCQRAIDHVRIKANQGGCILSTQLDQSTTAIVSHGVKHLGIYNSKRALLRSSDGKLRSQSILLLHFYANQMEAYVDNV